MYTVERVLTVQCTTLDYKFNLHDIIGANYYRVKKS